ncbi:MAG TPA: hypothetical protein VM889_03785 [Candidatus Thermoplasmatota archaeon]|nr:hypothetical protein [Candidatus Thermoplasmatota archaeon]
MLDLAYAPDVPRAMLDVLEHHGRRLGLPLSTLEAIGQSLDLVERFIVECERGYGEAFADFVIERGAGAAAFAARAASA